MADRKKNVASIPRRKFLQLSAAGIGAAGAVHAATPESPSNESPSRSRNDRAAQRPYNAAYSGAFLNRVAFPLGGLGAGMICLEGTGALSHVSLRNRPEVFHEPLMFAALGIKGQPEAARVLEGQVPAWKLFGNPGTGNGAAGTSFGLPRFR